MKRMPFASPLLLVLILLLSLILRVHNYATWPRHGATFDEYAWTWLGMSIIQTGIPESWSYHPQYRYKHPVNIQGANFILVRPYLEHPPFFGLVAGAFARITSARAFADVKLASIRWLAIALGLISVTMVCLLATRLYGVPTGMLAGLLYGIMPTAVIGSRLVQNENFFIPVWLTMLYLTEKFLDTRKPVLRVFIGLLGGILILSKIPWIAGILSVFAILWFNKRQKDALTTLGISVGIGLLYIAYGLITDKEVFLGLMGLQLNRYDITFIGVYSLWLKPLITDRFFLDGWVYFGWLSMLILAANLKKHAFLLFPLLSYGCIYVLGIPDEAGHGWYRYPFYPFLAIASAFVAREYILQSPVYRTLGLLAIGLPAIASSWGASFGFSYVIYRSFILASLASFLPVAFPGKKSEGVSNTAFYGLCVLIFFLTVWTVLGYNEQ